jgi:tRNA (cytidine/uridine-2'-O-)-methyltransferase
MFEVVLIHPEIPPNTGNVIRLCANTGARLHLVEPLGFALTEARLRRAGMDYAELASVQIHPDWTHCCAALTALSPQGRRFALTTKGTLRPAMLPTSGPGMCWSSVVRRADCRQKFSPSLPPSNACACRCGQTIAASTSPTPSP